jgi:NAD(P)-dependent dehydrogenase (short-subunit alcohol dehydrogenase family)
VQPPLGRNRQVQTVARFGRLDAAVNNAGTEGQRGLASFVTGQVVSVDGGKAVG